MESFRVIYKNEDNSVAADVTVSREEYPERFLREDRQAPTNGRFCGTLGYGSKFK